jgi:LysM repeat protein
MDQLEEKEMQEAMEEIAEDLRYTRANETMKGVGRPSDGAIRRKTLIVWGAAILVLSILIGLLFRGGRQVSRAELATVRARLERIEKQLTLLSGMDQRIAHLEEQQKTLEQSIVLTENFSKGLTERLEKLGEKVDGIQGKMATLSAQKKPAASAPAPKKTQPESKGRYHQVRQGETPFSIAKRYGLSLEKLYSLNKLSPNEVLQPGQRLLVSPK